MFYSPRQERVRHFSSQEVATRICLRKGIFAWPKKRGWKKTNKQSPWSAARGGRRKKISHEKQKRQILNAIFLFTRRKVSSEQIFKRTVVVDCSCTLVYSPHHHFPGEQPQFQKRQQALAGIQTHIGTVSKSWRIQSVRKTLITYQMYNYKEWW